MAPNAWVSYKISIIKFVPSSRKDITVGLSIVPGQPNAKRGLAPGYITKNVFSSDKYNQYLLTALVLLLRTFSIQETLRGINQAYLTETFRP